MKPYIILFISLLPLFGFTQTSKHQFRVAPAKTAADGWQAKTIKVLKQRYFLHGISPEKIKITQVGSSLEIKCSCEVDPITLKHISTAQGQYMVYPVHRFDDPHTKNLYTVFFNGNVRVSNGSNRLLDYFKINDYALAKHKYRRYPPAVIGMASAANIGVVNQFLESSLVQNAIPANSRFYWSRKASRLHPGMYDLYLANANPEYDQPLNGIENIKVLTKENRKN